MIKSNLKVLLAMNNMTQRRLSELTGIRAATITNIINNRCKQLPVDAIDKICELLNCNVGDLFCYVNQNEINQSKKD